MDINRIIAMVVMLTLNLAVSAQEFVVNVKINDMPEGAAVKLCNEMYKMNVYAEGVVTNGMVRLSGEIKNPVLAELQINDKATYAKDEFEKKRFIQFMLSDTIINISAPYFEDIPYTYEYGKQPIEKEMNSKVEGGMLQRHYEQWRSESFPYRYAVYKVEYEIWNMNYGPDSQNRTPEQKAIDAEREPKLKASLADKREEYNKFRDSFLATHPTYSVSLDIVLSKLAKSFSYSEDEINAMVAILKDNENTTAYSSLLEEAEKAKHFLKNSYITDFKVESPDGAPSTFKEVFEGIKDKPYKAVLIDFWASWCGPCRASIPSVKHLYSAKKDKLAIVSVSVDRKEDDWKSAMNQEQMPWLQLRSLPSESKILTDSYNLLGIPSIFIVSPEGKILFFTHDADEAHRELEHIL